MTSPCWSSLKTLTRTFTHQPACHLRMLTTLDRTVESMVSIKCQLFHILAANFSISWAPLSQDGAPQPLARRPTRWPCSRWSSPSSRTQSARPRPAAPSHTPTWRPGSASLTRPAIRIASLIRCSALEPVERTAVRQVHSSFITTMMMILRGTVAARSQWRTGRQTSTTSLELSAGGTDVLRWEYHSWCWWSWCHWRKISTIYAGELQSHDNRMVCSI